MILSKFILPFPPSVNSPYIMRNGRRAKSSKIIHWEESAKVFINKQNITPITERVILVYSLNTPDNRIRDAANYEKITTDLLVSRGILQDDSRREIKGIYSYWNDIPGKTIEITIYTADSKLEIP